MQGGMAPGAHEGAARRETRPRVTVLTGAGISTGAGIPDFRGPQGLWTLHPELEELLEIDRYLTDPAVREAGWLMWRDHPAWYARPTAAHRALAALDDAGLLTAVLTQNFDGLHQLAGVPAEKVVELHGTLRTTSCTSCGRTTPTPEVLGRLETDPDPRCPVCGGILKADVTYFGEGLPEGSYEHALEASGECDLFLAVGTSLGVQPVAGLPAFAGRAGAELVIVNADPTPYDWAATRVVREPIEQALPALVAELLARTGA